MIKKSLIVLLIFIYSFVIFKDFIPQLIYKINFDYIVKNLCEQKEETENLCMGQCFFNKKVKQEAEENNKTTPINLNTKNIETHTVSAKHFEIDFTDLQTDKRKFSITTLSTLSNNIKPLLPPPKFLFS